MAGPIELRTHFGLGVLRQPGHSESSSWERKNHVRETIIPQSRTLPVNCQLIDVSENGRLRLTFQIHGLNLNGSTLEKLHFLKAKRWYIPEDADDSVYCVLPDNKRLVWATIQQDTVYCAVRITSPIFPPLFEFEEPIEKLVGYNSTKMGITPKNPDLIILGFPRK